MNEIHLYLPKAPMRGRLLMKGRTWRAQWGKSKDEKKDWRLLIRSKIGAQRPRKPLRGVEIDMVIYRRVIDRDADNLMFSLKPLLDTLKDERVIFEDSEKHTTVNKPRQVKVERAEDEMTMVVIKKRL